VAVVLLLLFLIVPIVEIYVIIQVGEAIGALPTIALLILVSVVGSWLVKREGVGVWQRAQAQLQRGEMPANELIDGILILLAGALMLTPGFVTDIVGVLLLLPPSRALLRVALVKRYRNRLLAGASFGGPGTSFVYSRVYDVQDVGDVTPPEWREGSRRDELGKG
jgi:UPF0716 protein FxsA